MQLIAVHEWFSANIKVAALDHFKGCHDIFGPGFKRHSYPSMPAAA
jgi:hypothetical protein